MKPATNSLRTAENSAKGIFDGPILQTNSEGIRDILFDLGNVLTPFDWDIALRRLNPYLSSQYAQLLNMDKERFKALFNEPSLALETGQIDFQRFQRLVEDIIEVRIPPPEFHTMWCDIFRMDQNVVALGKLLSIHYRTWLVSNTSEAHYRWITEKFPDVVFYRGAALSYELGVMKPRPEFYRKVIANFDISPEAALFIDDLPENVDGAIRAGMHGIVFQGAETLLPRLSELGIETPGVSEVDIDPEQ